MKDFIKEDNFEEKCNQFFENYISEYNKKQSIVKSEEYKNWLVSFIDILGHGFCDDDFLYCDDENITKVDKDYVACLRYFYNYVEKLGEQQKVLPIIDDSFTFYFKLKGKFYSINLILGQGTITFVKPIQKEPDCYYVFIDEGIPKEKLEKRDIVLCFLINNKNIIEDNERTKLAIKITALLTQEYQSSLIFENWIKNPSIQFKEVNEDCFNNLCKTKNLLTYENAITSLGFITIEEMERTLLNYQ